MEGLRELFVAWLCEAWAWAAPFVVMLIVALALWMVWA